MRAAHSLPSGGVSAQGCLCPGRVSVQGGSLSRGYLLGRPPQTDPPPLEGTWDQRQTSPGRNMGPETETLQPDWKWHHTETPSPCEHQKSKTGATVAPQKGQFSSKNYFKKYLLQKLTPSRDTEKLLKINVLVLLRFGWVQESSLWIKWIFNTNEHHLNYIEIHITEVLICSWGFQPPEVQRIWQQGVIYESELSR